MTYTVINPFQGSPVAWTWADHVAAGYTGGTDYKFSGPVVAAMDGEARAFGLDQLNAVSITAPDGLVVTVREMLSQEGTFPRTVKQGEVIAHTGLIRPPLTSARFPHIDANRPSDGNRVPFEQYLTSTASVGPVTPITTPKDDDMPTPIVATDTGTYGTTTIQAGTWGLWNGGSLIYAHRAEDIDAWANALKVTRADITDVGSTITSRMSGVSFAILATQVAANK